MEANFNEIYRDHLWKDKFIGPGDDNKFPTLIEYTTKTVPYIEKKLLKTEE
jgi:hypothetical protein